MKKNLNAQFLTQNKDYLELNIWCNSNKDHFNPGEILSINQFIIEGLAEKFPSESAHDLTKQLYNFSTF